MIFFFPFCVALGKIDHFLFYTGRGIGPCFLEAPFHGFT